MQDDQPPPTFRRQMLLQYHHRAYQVLDAGNTDEAFEVHRRELKKALIHLRLNTSARVKLGRIAWWETAIRNKNLSMIRGWCYNDGEQAVAMREVSPLPMIVDLDWTVLLVAAKMAPMAHAHAPKSLPPPKAVGFNLGATTATHLSVTTASLTSATVSATTNYPVASYTFRPTHSGINSYGNYSLNGVLTDSSGQSLKFTITP